MCQPIPIIWSPASNHPRAIYHGSEAGWRETGLTQSRCWMANLNEFFYGKCRVCSGEAMIRTNAAWRLGGGLAIALLAFHGGALAQSQAIGTKDFRFEVATIKPSPYSPSSNFNFSPDSVAMQNMSLHDIMVFAYHLTSDRQLIGGPKWVSSAKFDIDAKADPAVAGKLDAMAPDERMNVLRSMIQKLLAERFQLRVHHEKRAISVLALTVVKSGSKLQPSNIAVDQGPSLHNSGHGRMTAKDVPMALLTRQLSAKPEIGGRTVVDETGLTGKYDFTLNWTPERESAAGAAGPSLFTALEEQLGLKLESTKAPVDVVVIDRAEMPSPN